MSVLHRRKWTIPYLLLAPGMAWLVVFFVVPLWYLAKMSLSRGPVPDLQLQLGLEQLRRRDLELPDAVHPLGRVRGDRDGDRARRQLSAGVLDRVPRRALEEPLPAPRDLAVLRHVPDPDARVGDDPVRQRGRRPDAAGRRDPRPGRPSARDLGGGDRGHHLQLPARSWSCRCTSASSRSTRG